MAQKCPQCHGEAIAEGKIYNLIDHVNPPAYFRPEGLPFFAIIGTNVRMENVFFACSFCGFVWSKIDTQELQRLVPRTRVRAPSEI